MAAARSSELLRRVTGDVPGTLVERKSCSVTWHYRQAEPEYGAWRARELLVAIEQMLHGAPAEILLGHRVIEVRARGVNKGAYVRGLFPGGKEGSHFVLAAGDDRTDMDLYSALPAGSIGVHVGRPPRRARDVSRARPVPGRLPASGARPAARARRGRARRRRGRQSAPV